MAKKENVNKNTGMQRLNAFHFICAKCSYEYIILSILRKSFYNIAFMSDYQ